jgi:hypothetical protein
MKFALLWAGLSLAVGFLANHRGRSGITWFQIALVISPIAAAAILALSPSRRPEPGGE